MDYADLAVLERIADIIQSLQRQAATEAGLQMVHFSLLDYLARANHYSNSTVAAAAWLGLTKGTVSQSLALLEARGYVRREPDEKDRRCQNLYLTEQGEEVVARTRTRMQALFENIEINGAYSRIFHTILKDILWQLQDRTGRSGFGACNSCRHKRTGPEGSRCSLNEDILPPEAEEKICRAHEFAA